MKKFLSIITIILMSLIIPSNVYAISTIDAKEEIDLTEDCNLTLNYYYDDYKFNETNVEIYYIASVTNDFRYNLSSDFLSYPIKINGIITDDEWTTLEQTLNAYIEADSINPIISTKIDENTITLTNLTPGLYFIKTDKIDTEDYTLIFDEFLISIPALNENGTWNYNVEVFPKAEEYIPKYEKIDYTVTKTWIDDGLSRPESIDIEIYEDGTLVESKILSSDNNWTYTWTTDDDGSTWTVVERNVKEGYNVSIQTKNRSFYIVNTDPTYQEENPSTGDNIKIYLYLFVSSLLGIILLVISSLVQRKNS